MFPLMNSRDILRENNLQSCHLVCAELLIRKEDIRVLEVAVMQEGVKEEEKMVEGLYMLLLWEHRKSVNVV